MRHTTTRGDVGYDAYRHVVTASPQYHAGLSWVRVRSYRVHMYIVKSPPQALFIDLRGSRATLYIYLCHSLLAAKTTQEKPPAITLQTGPAPSYKRAPKELLARKFGENKTRRERL